MTTRDLVERFDPDDDLVSLLRVSDRVIAQERRRATPPSPPLTPELEAMARQIATSLVPATEDAALGRVPRGPRPPLRPGPRPGPRFGPRGLGRRWAWAGPDWPPPWCPWADEEDEIDYGSALRGSTPRAGSRALVSEPKGLLDVFDPRHNLREMAKELLLLEDHLAQPAKHCPDCIRKHLLKTEALAEEAVQLDKDGSMRDRLVPLPGQIRNLQRAFLADADRNALQQEVRELRKVLSKESFDALAFKTSSPAPGSDAGSPNRTPIVFAMERGRERMGAEETPKTLPPLPSTVVAALRRRVSAGVSEERPAPVFVRARNKDGTTAVLEGEVIGTRGEGTLIVRSVEAEPRTFSAAQADTILDLSADDTFRQIPWPALLPLSRKGGVEELSIVPGTSAWQSIRIIASVLWPVVDAFALTYARTDEGARQAILRRLLLAAVVNAAYESTLNASLEGDKGRAVGLFQLRDDGAGLGMSKADRKDPFLNTARIAQRFLEVKKFFVPLAETEGKVPGSTPPGAWTGLFARYVEAPSERDLAERLRGETAAAAFPRGMPVVERAPPVVAVPKTEKISVLPWVLGGIALTTVVVGLGSAVIRSRGR